MKTDSERIGIDIECCNDVRVSANLKLCKVPVPKGADLGAKVALLVKHYDVQAQGGVQMAQCDRCNGPGPAELDACPFCGEPNGDAPSSRVGGGESEVESEGTVTRTSTALAKVSAGTSINVQPRPNISRPVRLATESDLEVAVGNIQQLRRVFHENAWDIGRQLILINEETKERPAMWRTRLEDDGKTPAYTSFKAFLRAECGFSMRMAESLMLIATEYTREQINLTGTAKIEVVLNAPPAKRQQLLAAAATTPIRKLRQQVKEQNIAAGRGAPQRAAREARALRERQANPAQYPAEQRLLSAATPVPVEKGTSAPVPAAAKDGLATIVFPKSRGKAWLYRKNTDADGKPIQAHQLSDNYGWIVGQNGMKLVITVSKAANGKLQVSWEAKRDS